MALSARPRLLLDACVLYPTVMRATLLEVAAEGLFVPLWSDRLLEEWARAAARHGPVSEAQARAEIALARATWPGAAVSPQPGLEARLWLPDPNDVHVLAAAIAGSAEAVVTLNAGDFPRHTLAEEGLARHDPDTLLHDLWCRAPEPVSRAAARVRANAIRHDPALADLRKLLKKARLPRLAKALATQSP